MKTYPVSIPAPKKTSWTLPLPKKIHARSYARPKKKGVTREKYHLAHDRRNTIPNVQNGLKRFKATRHHPPPQKSNGSPLTLQ